jgi:hypothetical protein
LEIKLAKKTAPFRRILPNLTAFLKDTLKFGSFLVLELHLFGGQVKLVEHDVLVIGAGILGLVNSILTSKRAVPFAETSW